jgi:hypothetical protein
MWEWDTNCSSSDGAEMEMAAVASGSDPFQIPNFHSFPSYLSFLGLAAVMM